MNFTDIAYKITGISVPIFGVSWNPPKQEKKIAEKIITFLEDRRVLYNPNELEIPEHCKQSIIQIRQFLTEQLYDIKIDSELSNIVRAMRSACRKFLDAITDSLYFGGLNAPLGNGNQIGLGGQMLFYSAVGELRGTFGGLIAQLLIRYGINCESDLLKILPLKVGEE